MAAKKPYGRSLSDFSPLLPGEKTLVNACRMGRNADLGDAVPVPYPMLGVVEVPGPVRVPEPVRVPITKDNCVRADFLRFLLLGGDEQTPMHESGLQLYGAYVAGWLDLSGCRISVDMIFGKCFFPRAINAQDSSVAGVFILAGSYLNAGLVADRLKCAAGVFLRNGFKSKGAVTLTGATIGGNVDCSGGHFEVDDGYALCVDGANILGSVYLNDGFMAKGEVRALGAQIAGDVDCEGGRFDPQTNDALGLCATVVRGRLFLRNLPNPVCIDVSHAEVAVLVDDLAAWAKGSSLDGLRYGTLGRPNGKDRLAWLLKQPEKHLNTKEFRPQPWRQLQRVLREMGHTEDAKLIGIAYEEHLRKIGHVGQSAEGKNRVSAWWRRITTSGAHSIFGLLAGYGYRPMRLVTWMLAMWLTCGASYWGLALPPFNAMAPSDPLVFQNPSYSECRPTQAGQSDSVEKQQDQPEQSGRVRMTGNWPFCSDMPGEYSTFSPWAYSLDLLLPVVDLGQEKYWGAYIPSPNEGAADESILNWRWGYFVRFVTWFETLFGWVSSLLLVAIISGFSRRNDEG